MKFNFSWLVLLLMIALVFTMGCEGEQGPEGPQGPAGPAGDDGQDGEDGEDLTEGPQYNYNGGFGAACNHCHYSTVMSWEDTGHRDAYVDLDDDDLTNPYCLKCHTTGWDSPVNYGDTEITEYGPDTTGYDDYFGKTDDTSLERMAMLEGVQCEACHGGMGPDFNAHRPLISFSTRTEDDGTPTSLCAPCHSGQLGEWAESGHGMVAGGSIEDFNNEHYAHISSCQPCHTSEGFIAATDPRYADYEFPHDVSFIGCVTCHDPHSNGNEHQVRTVGDVPVLYHPGYEVGDPEIPTMTGMGTAQVCGQCHHGRRDTDNVLGQIENGYAHFGPHGSPQMDLWLGGGSYEIADLDYETTNVHEYVSCVKCHMVREAEIHGETQDHSFHTFASTTGNCEPCHTGLPDFDYRSLQTNVDDKMNTIAVAFGYTNADDMIENWDSTGDDVTVWQREAAYALFFVYNDGSKGVHNPRYAEALLDNAIAHIDANTP